MCGIAGWLGPPTDDDRITRRMIEAIRHRGPDAQQAQGWPEGTLLHSRLSIIDLSPAGAQPMSNEDGTVWVVFNGEIYNHRSLQARMEARGHRFRGRSDTEVLPHLYEELGPDMVAELRGMFALAILDLRRRRLLLARDRFGIKPLFYAATPTRLAFASEINALRIVPQIDTTIDEQAIYDYTAFFCIPAPATIFKGIRALEPGQLIVAELEEDRPQLAGRSFHSWQLEPNHGLTLESAADRVEGLLNEAVSSQLESDVPLASLLSGGIDSSLVSVAASAASPTLLNTFNVQFPDDEFDETWAAKAVAERIESHHRTIAMRDVSSGWDEVTQLLVHAGQPFADTSMFAVNAVCKAMREHVTVVLSGDGGDESFGGYDVFGETEQVARKKSLPAWTRWLLRQVLAPTSLMGITPAHWPDRIRYIDSADAVTLVQDQLMWIGRDELERLWHGRELLPIRRYYEPRWDHIHDRRGSLVERMSGLLTEATVRLHLPNDFLFKVDTASMHESLEIRVPMLDEALFDFGLTLPHRLKSRGGVGKQVLRAVAERQLPSKVASKRKMGFAIPMDAWVGKQFRVRLREELTGKRCRLRDLLDARIYEEWVHAFCDGRPIQSMSRLSQYQRVFMLLSLNLALERGVPAGVAPVARGTPN